MAGNLHFDVTARDSASSEFAAISRQLAALSKQLRDLDGKKAKADVALNGAAQVQAQAKAIRIDVDSLDGRHARVSISLDSASSAPITVLSEQLDRIDGRTAKAHVTVDVDKDVPGRLAGVADGLARVGTVAGAAASGAARFRSAAQMLVNPAQIPVIQGLSDAIADKFHGAVEKARVGVEKLDVGVSAMHKSLLALGAAGAGVQAIGGLVTSLIDLSGAALLVPGAVGGAAVAVGAAKIAFANFWAAVNADTPKKFAKATEDMSKSALSVVLVLRDMKSALSGTGSVGSVIQANMFSGLVTPVQQLGQVYLPLLKNGLGETATIFNGMAKSTLAWASSLQTTAQVRLIIDNTNVALRTMRDTVTNAASGFLTLATAGSSWLPRMSAAIDAASVKFKAWSERIVADGSFDRWVTKGVDAFKQLGTILGNVGSIAGTVFSALNGNGAGFLATLANLTTQMRAFLATTQGASALKGLATTMSAVGDAMQRVLMAALRQLGPLMTALAPAATALATALGDNLVHIIDMAGPIITRFAEALSSSPGLLVALAHAASVVVIGFGPMVAIIGVVATLLKGFVLASVAGAALSALGLSGTVAARVLMALVSPMALIREAMPLIARGAGLLAAQLGIIAGPIGVLIVAFATLYATSSQFRDAMNGIAQTVGSILMQALRDAGDVINSTVLALAAIGGAVDTATAGLQSFGSSIMSVFGPVGDFVSGVLSGLFDWLGKLPGAALAAFAAFRVFGMIAPIFATASTAVAAFSARMLAFQASSALGAASATAAGKAAAGLSTALSKAGAALPLIGVALVALGYAYDQIRGRQEEFAQSIVQGTMSTAQAVAAQTKIYGEGFSGLANAFIGGSEGIKRWTDANYNAQKSMEEVHQKTEEYLSTLGPLEQAQARVQISSQNLRDLQASGTATTQQVADATQVLARDQANLDTVQGRLAAATRGTTEAMKAQQDQMQGQVNASLAYKEALQQTTEAQTTAADAIKKNGAGSDEAKSATLNLARAYEQQAEAAGKVAGATGGAAAEAQAYGLEIQSLDRSSQAGKAAFIELASGMTQTSLDALSATAKMTNLRTEVIKLPNGKTVTVVVAADQAKLDEIKNRLDAFRSANVSITLVADVNPATGQIQAVATLANGTTAAIQLTGNPTQANGVITQTVTMANGQTGTMTYRADALQADGTVKATVAYADGTSADMTFRAVDGPARSTIAGTVAWAAQQTPTMIAKAMTGDAEANLAYLARTRTAYINVITTGATSSGNLRLNNPTSGGGVFGYSGGGLVGRPTMNARGGLVIPGYAPGVDDVPIMASKGEAVLVPEAVKALGASRIMAMNREMSGGRPGTVTGSIAGIMDGTIRGTGPAAGAMDIRRGATGASTGYGSNAALISEVRGLRADNGQLRGALERMEGAIQKQRPFVVEDRSGNPVETARATALALAIA